MKKIAVVGGGFFGLTAAIALRRSGNDVALFERNAGLVREASLKNQYRLHRGYHYPRSIETAMQSNSGYLTLQFAYPDCMSSRLQKHYYAIANESIVGVDEYKYFLKQCNLSYTERAIPKFINPNLVAAYLEVAEFSLNFEQFRYHLLEQIEHLNVNVHLDAQFTREMIDDYEVIINATYSNINSIVSIDQQIDYQFEICEKPIVRLNSDFANKSIVVIDGEFGCIDPVNGGNHLLGHVRDAIHHRSIGHFPEIPDGYSELLNPPACLDHSLSKIEIILDSMQDFFPTIRDGFSHYGSMYVIRTVLPDRDHDDARPSYITKHNDRLYSIFSGKIGTCVDIANELVKMINSEN